MGCAINGTVMRQARTSDLIFSVLRIVAKLAAILPLPPDDLIFTGTPSGVGGAREVATAGLGHDAGYARRLA